MRSSTVLHENPPYDVEAARVESLLLDGMTEHLVATLRKYVLCDLQLVEKEAGDLDLQLNHNKSELMYEDPARQDPDAEGRPGLQVTDMDQAKILGTPVGSQKSLDDAIEGKIRLLGLMGERLQLLQAQDVLLTSYYATPSPSLTFLISFVGTLHGLPPTPCHQQIAGHPPSHSPVSHLPQSPLLPACQASIVSISPTFTFASHTMYRDCTALTSPSPT